MKSKKITSIIFASIAIVLATSFALFPFLEHKINWDYIAAKLVLKAADSGCLDLAKKVSEDIKFKPFLNKANAHIALFKLQNESEDAANDFIKTCGKYFDFEEYYARKTIGEIASEPQLTKAFLELKYRSQIDVIKSPFLKALLLYNLAIKVKENDAQTYTKEAIAILKTLIKSEELTTTCAEISQMAFKANRPKDFFAFLKLCNNSSHWHIASLQSLCDKNFITYILKNNAYDYTFRSVRTMQEMFAKNPPQPLEIGKSLKYALYPTGFNWRTTEAYTNFNLPLIAYIAYVTEKKDLFKDYKDLCISPDTINSIQGSKYGYLNNAAAFFTASNELNYALNLIKFADSNYQKFPMLNSIALQLPLQKDALEEFYKALHLAK